MFFTNYSTYEGEPARLYRSPTDIRRDIYEIKEKIAKCNEMLNVRGILTETITDLSLGEPSGWICALRAIVEDAEDTLSTLNELKATLDCLKEELEDTRCVLGV